MSLDQDKSFYCVVDGMVQVFAQTGQPTQGQQGLWDDEDMNGYQLLNEVGSGGTLSSLFTILSLFTEDVKMSWQDDPPKLSSDDVLLMPAHNRSRRANSDVSQLNLDLKSKVHSRRGSASSTASTINAIEAMSPRIGSRSHPDSDNMSDSSTTQLPSLNRAERVRLTQIHRGVVARATEDTTLAVIPAEAFRRLTKKFPKATGHIVQGESFHLISKYNLSFFIIVILARFSRVTFNAAHKYLGLTSEVLRTEKAINDIACHPLPASFYEGGGLQYLRQRFDGASASASDTEGDYFAFTHSPSVMSHTAKSGESLNPLNGKISESPVTSRATPLRAQSSSFRPQSSRHIVHAGDLLSSTTHPSEVFGPLSRTFSVVNTPRVPRGPGLTDNDKKSSQSRRAARLSGDDFDLKEEVMSCIAKSIGLLQPPLSGSDSVEASPAFPPSESGGSSGIFNSSFSSLSLFDVGDDSSSVTGGSPSVGSPGSYMSGLDNEVEILFFAAGSTLARAGELNTGEIRVFRN
jgi:lysophospholipid hydrolase